MISINIPGWGTANVENIILDLNGTIATDGIISQLVKDKIKALSEKVKIYLLTVNTQGTATRETAGGGPWDCSSWRRGDVGFRHEKCRHCCKEYFGCL